MHIYKYTCVCMDMDVLIKELEKVLLLYTLISDK